MAREARGDSDAAPEHAVQSEDAQDAESAESQHGKMRAPSGIAARVAAATLLMRVLDHGLFLDAAEAREAARLKALHVRDRAFTHRLVRETLRRLGQIDHIIDKQLESPLPDDAGPIRIILRLATAETRFLGAKPHAAVDSAVTLARRAGPRFSGLVNAVSRRIAEGVDPGEADVSDYAALHGLTPPWLRAMLIEDWGEERAGAIAYAHLAEPPLDLTPRAPDPVAAAALARSIGESATATVTGSARLSAPGAISALPGFEEGRWWVQDAAAAIPARLLGVGRGQTAIDLCAAPGGKTLQLAATGAAVTAVDMSERRLATLRANLERTRLSATLVAADARDWRPETPADAVLLDAPCSASGTIRRHPDLPHVKDGDGLNGLAGLQDRLIETAWEMVRPGGRLVFCTCSLFKLEGEDRGAAALERLPGVALDPITAEEVGDAALIQDGALRCLPDHWEDSGGIDGFYAIRLRKADTA